jgi:tRNA threonylcarbamoyladenosine biosynthesis protein TsaB
MALILQIETATRSCSIALAQNGQVIALKELNEANIHASHITLFIEEAMKKADKSLEELDAVAVSMGPGSYTGLRIGVSCAKGLCYALDKPLIAVSTLAAMAAAKKGATESNNLLCPMIDARRMEVYMALFDQDLSVVEPVKAQILDEHTFDAYSDNYLIQIFGDGAEKCKSLYQGAQFVFSSHVNSAADLSSIAHEKFLAHDFEDLAYFEPYYLKDFIATKPKDLR